MQQSGIQEIDPTYYRRFPVPFSHIFLETGDWRLKKYA
jgi:hypothetical protein